MNHSRVIYSLVVLSLIGCGGPTKTTETEETTIPENTKEEALPFGLEVGTTLFKGVYATSENIPHADYGYANAFDNDPNTAWETMPGAGPDEGLMLYFDSPVALTHIQIEQPSGNQFSTIKSFNIYVNGRDPFSAAAEGDIALNQDGISSVYVRVNGVNDENTAYLPSESADISTRTFPGDKRVAISEIKLFTENGQLNVRPPIRIPGTVQASSTLAPAQSYGVRNLFDSRKEFAWVEGGEGNGIGESITLQLDDEIDLTGLKIANGYQRSTKHYKANARLKSLTVTAANGAKETLTFDDANGESSAKLTNPMKGKQFTFTIEEAFEGTSYKDLVISELKLVSGSIDISVATGRSENFKRKLIEEQAGTILSKYLDKRSANDLQYGPDEYEYRSLILRSDYTFVMYNITSADSEAGNETVEIVADGNWEIKKSDSSGIQLRVFGRLARLSESFDYYAGATDGSSYEQIFQDLMTLTTDEIQGGKFIPTIRLK